MPRANLVRCAFLFSAALAISTAASAQGWTPEYKDGVLQPLADGFPNQEITIVVPDDPTSAEGILATQVANVAKQFSPVGIRTEIRQDFQAMPTWEALAYVKREERGKEGYMIITFSHAGSLADTLAADVKATVGVDRSDMQPVIGLEIARWFMTQCADVAWEPTIQALIDQIKANPGKVRYMGQGAGGGVDLGFFSTMKHFGINADQLDAIPIGGTVEQATATAACEGDVTNTTVEPIMPHIQKERVKLIFMNGTQRVPEFPDVPTAADLGMTNGGLMSGKELITSSDVSPEHLAWLYELFRKATEQQEYIDGRHKIPGLVVEIRNPADTQKLFDDTVDEVRAVLDDLGLLVMK
jgi:tripartite-type tricarboxylate transporter receptor subunit TctC